MNFVDLVAQLDGRLREPLPGRAAQQRMAPRPRSWPPGGVEPALVRSAAGLLLVFPIDHEAHVVLTVRADTLERHGGQVSLPGGVIEPGESFEAAALREAHEEVGLALDVVRPLGSLSPLDIQVSGFRLHPIVAAASLHPTLRPSDGEVARVLEVPVATLMDPQRLAWRSLERDGRAIEFPVFLVDDAEVWGATAMVLAEFLTLLGWTGPAADRS